MQQAGNRNGRLGRAGLHPPAFSMPGPARHAAPAQRPRPAKRPPPGRKTGRTATPNGPFRRPTAPPPAKACTTGRYASKRHRTAGSHGTPAAAPPNATVCIDFYTPGYCMAGMIVVSLQKTRRHSAMCDQCCIAPVCNALAEGKTATGTGATRLATARPPSTRKESRPRQTGKPRPRPKAGPLQQKQTA